ncbi:MAG: Recombinase [Planctomycetaceae bacterium]|nr:Recombinase [Planctomycetaceae bacterium]
MRVSNHNLRGPKDGRTWFVVLVVRISTIHQYKRSLDDQIAKCKQFVESEYSGTFNYQILQSRGSGEHLDRKELEQLMDFIESGSVDLVVAEDLGRICRRNRAMDLCELCQDQDTRLVAINDRVDTTEEGWEDSAAMATWHHSRSNRDTSKRSLNNRFDQGQLMEGLPFGYIRPKGATSDIQVTKDPEAEPILTQMFRSLENGANYSEIADWLNGQNVPTGPYCRVDKWDCNFVSRLVHDPLLKGIRIHNRMVTKRLNKTGRHHSIKAPPEMLKTRLCPHLAFFEPAYYDHVVRELDERNAKYRRGKNGNVDSRTGVYDGPQKLDQEIR